MYLRLRRYILTVPCVRVGGVVSVGRALQVSLVSAFAAQRTAGNVCYGAPGSTHSSFPCLRTSTVDVRRQYTVHKRIIRN